jgi:TPP-dependent pyruvate/acetoin dehydrogenase alpha subunit
MHLVDASHGVLGTSAVVGTTVPNAVGYAYGVKYRRTDQVVVSFFGDGATDEGVFHESLNFAALKRLPIIFVCENNRYAIHTHQTLRQAYPHICERARAHGIPAECIEDNDLFAVYERVGSAVREIRAGKAGPYFLECMTYRWKEHVGPNDDYHLGFRTREEAEPWIKNDQVPRLGGMLGPEVRARIEAEVEAEIRAAFHFAETSPFPECDELFTHVFKDPQ